MIGANFSIISFRECKRFMWNDIRSVYTSFMSYYVLSRCSVSFYLLRLLVFNENDIHMCCDRLHLHKFSTAFNKFEIVSALISLLLSFIVYNFWPEYPLEL